MNNAPQQRTAALLQQQPACALSALLSLAVTGVTSVKSRVSHYHMMAGTAGTALCQAELYRALGE